MTETILVVEDDADLAEVVQFALESRGFATSLAHNGVEALAAVSTRMPSLIILDMMMPVMNGWEFADEFHAQFGHAAPILVVTAAENAKMRGDEVDAEGVLAKPFTPSALIASVQRLLAQSQHPRAEPATNGRPRPAT
jgi:DNA-binding response OmpR family regulator